MFILTEYSWYHASDIRSCISCDYQSDTSAVDHGSMAMVVGPLAIVDHPLANVDGALANVANRITSVADQLRLWLV